MLPIFVFIALPTLSLALLLAILLRRLHEAVSRPHHSDFVLSRAMTRLEALQLLGLDDAADARTIRTAYKRLMIKYHPDHGGSHNAAARLNMARDTLLRSKRHRAA